MIWILTRVSFLFKEHLCALYSYLDPVKNDDWPFESGAIGSDGSTDGIRRQFIYALIIFVACLLEGIFGMQTEYGLGWDVEALLESPVIVGHQMTPRVMWYEAEIILLGTTPTTIVVLYIFAQNSQQMNGCAMHPSAGETGNLVANNKILSRQVSEQIIQASHWARRAIRALSLTFYLLIMLYLYYNVLITNAAFNVTTHSMFVLLIANPIYIYYMIHIVLTLPLFVVISSAYIRIRQKAVLDRLIRINHKLLTGCPINVQSAPYHAFCYHHLLEANREVLKICQSIKASARFWAPYLTVIFPYLIFVQCYMLYLAIFPEKAIPIELKWVYSCVAAQIILLFYLLIRECAAVVHFNKRITRQNRRFFLIYYRKQMQQAGIYKPIQMSRLLKAESFLDGRRLHSYAFRLFNNYRITSNTFHATLLYIGILFMAIYKYKMGFS